LGPAPRKPNRARMVNARPTDKAIAAFVVTLKPDDRRPAVSTPLRERCLSATSNHGVEVALQADEST
jgi:hypothetical protein